MAFFIRIEREQDLKWLQNILSNSIDRIKRGASNLEDASEHIVRVYESVINAVPGKEAESLGITDEFTPEELKNSKKDPDNKDPKFKYNHCSAHPYNKIARAPASDCKGCWAAYKKLHPEKYDQAIRAHKRKQSSA